MSSTRRVFTATCNFGFDMLNDGVPDAICHYKASNGDPIKLISERVRFVDMPNREIRVETESGAAFLRVDTGDDTSLIHHSKESGHTHTRIAKSDRTCATLQAFFKPRGIRDDVLGVMCSPENNGVEDAINKFATVESKPSKSIF